MARLVYSVINTGGGTFDPNEKNVYFLASNVERMFYGAQAHDHLLVAVNELNTPKDVERLEGWLRAGKKVFIDSGVFNLTMEHVRTHGTSMDAALALGPEEIDGFAGLFEKYVALVTKYQAQVWGYIELDQGGRENKIKTRARLEALGLRPVPVYHPLNDGWDYFDYLAERYDRICFGNVVQADRETRKQLVMTAWHRHCKYPHLWIHLLGLTPNEWLNALPINSGDSSSWLSVVKWSGYKPKIAGETFGVLPKDFGYVLNGDPASESGSRKATILSGFGSYIQQRNWRNLLTEYETLGCNLYPESVYG